MGSKRFKVAVLEDFYYILVTSSMHMYDVRQIFFNRIKDGNQWKIIETVSDSSFDILNTWYLNPDLEHK